MAKCMRVLEALRRHREGGEGEGCLNRVRLAAEAKVTLRNLDAIVKSLRNQGYEIRWEENSGYELGTPAQGVAFRVRSPEGYHSLKTLRAFVGAHEELVERDRWLTLLDDILDASEYRRRKRVGRGFQEALVDDDGLMYRVDEPEILYLDVHRARPASLTRNHVERLREAIRDRHPVRLLYVDRQGVKDRVVVEPYFIFHREGTFYLGGVQTHSGDAPLKSARFKPFTITTMRCLSLDIQYDRSFEPQERFSAAKRLNRTGIRGLDGDGPVEAEFEVFGRFAYNACETDHGENSKTEWLGIGPHAQHLRMKATFGSLYDLVRYILSFGEFAVLTKPEEVRSILKQNVRGMAARYGIEIAKPAHSELKASDKPMRKTRVKQPFRHSDD